jgi:dihydrodipicolinate synthase/N-acetylneuraminate lyase
MGRRLDQRVQRVLARGVVIPAHPLALTEQRRFDERRQRAISRYYISAGVGGLAVGVHTTQFAIHDPRIGLFEPVLKLATEEMDYADKTRDEPLVRIAGICGDTTQATREAQLLSDFGYHAGLLSLAALKNADNQSLVQHCRAVSEIMPIIGFYLQPAADGRILPYRFWREFMEIENIVAIKIAPFNRYQTLDVLRAVAESEREIALYTGNDDNIIMDLLTPFEFQTNGGRKQLRIVGGLLGHWAVWTRKAVELLIDCQVAAGAAQGVPEELLRRAVEVTDSNAAFFDAANQFAGCIAGLHEVLRRQGLLEGTWCLDPHEEMSPGQREEIDRVYRAYPHLNDDAFVAQHLDEWLTP